MRKNTMYVFMRRLLFAVLIIAVNILQNTRGFFFEPLGVRAFLLIPLTVSIGMFERSYAGAFFGLFAGALWDTVSPSADGYNALILMLFAAVCGLMINLYMRNHLLTAFILTGGACLLYSLLYVLFFAAVRGLDSIDYLVFRFYLPAAVYSALFTPVFYLAVRGLMKATTVEESY